MRVYSLSHLGDPELLHHALSLAAQKRDATVGLLACLAEIDARKLYLPQAYPSLFAYCVGELRLEEEAAYKHIRAARAAQQFPALFPAVAEGRLHLSGVLMLAPYLTPENADELLAAAAHRSKKEIGELLAQRFPRADLPARVTALPEPSSSLGAEQLAPERVELSAPARMEAHTPPGAAPAGPERFLPLKMGRSMQDKLRYAQELLGHELPSGEAAQVLELGLDALIEKLEKRKFAATAWPQRSPRPSRNPRHIPAHVKRAVWERDGGQCTFVSEAGRRCAGRKFLEFDHVVEVARGGGASVAGIRLRCRAHNQYGAECTFGAEFMRGKREEARRAAEARAAAEEVVTPLRLLGYSAAEARRAAALCEAIPEASLEERVRRALSYFHPKPRVLNGAATGPGAAP